MFKNIFIDRDLAKAFSVTARCACFRQAARSLNVHPTSLRKQLRNLEVEIGEQLLHYQERALHLTNAGTLLHQELARRYADLNADDTYAELIRIAAPEALLNDIAVDTYGYQCPGCQTHAFPRSYCGPENLVRAHFQLRDPHVSSCEVEGETKVIAQGKRGSVQQELETSPGLSPARLQLIEDRTIVDPALPHTESQTQSVRRSDGATGLVRREGRRAANSIRPICRAFLRFPFDRHLSLAIPGIAPTTY
ncbi:LysR family transcriptional regulator [Pseudomonas kuykendallii]|uniref:helix-turn-helix domain-containing protein n=1 Tax=Pseudomonas kuykendallii TaxID=1007099 RepID=UPI0028D54DCD|nr:LysR family transcriptional regulator [Pseudomonas kuykendallii]